MEPQQRPLKQKNRFPAKSNEKAEVGQLTSSSTRASSNRSREFVRRVKDMPREDRKAAFRELEAAERQQLEALETGNKCNRAHGMTGYIYHSCISALAKDGRRREAIDVLGRIQRSGEVPPKVHCVTAALNACANASQCAPALELLTEARGWGFEGNAISYNVVLSGLGRGGVWETALRLFREMGALDVPPDA